MHKIEDWKCLISLALLNNIKTHLGGVMRHQSMLNPFGRLFGFTQSSFTSAVSVLTLSFLLTACGGSSTSYEPQEYGKDGTQPSLELVEFYNKFASPFKLLDSEKASSEVRTTSDFDSGASCYGGLTKKENQTVVVKINANESIMQPTVRISSTETTESFLAEVTEGQHGDYIAELWMGAPADPASVVEGEEVTTIMDVFNQGDLTFTINYTDNSGEDGVEGTSVLHLDDNNAIVVDDYTISFDSNCGINGVDGEWQLAQMAGAMGVGPVVGSMEWWSNSEADLLVRSCLFDDTYKFEGVTKDSQGLYISGNFENIMDGRTWQEPFQNDADAEICGDPTPPLGVTYDGDNTTGTWTFDPDAFTLQLDGLGAHVGLAKVYNGGELGDPGDAVSQITYSIAALTGNSMTLDIPNANGWWRFILERKSSELNIDPKLLGDWKLAPEEGAYAIGPSQGEVYPFPSAKNSLADVTTQACLFDDIYRFNPDGTFEVITDGDTWIPKEWSGAAADACGAPLAPYDGTPTGKFNFFDKLEKPNIELLGTGIYLGLSEVINGDLLDDPSGASSAIIYELGELTEDGRMTLDIEVAGGAWRQFKFVKVTD